MRRKTLLLVIIAVCSLHLSAQDNSQTRFEEFVRLEEKRFLTTGKSPLTEEDMVEFKTLNYFDFNKAWVVSATWEPLENETPFEMATSTDRSPTYVRVGKFTFTIEEKTFELYAYQSYPEAYTSDDFENPLFIPFNDLTNGVESYGGGRYLEMERPNKTEAKINFNMTYHPYCAYNHKYSCPVPPEENMLNIRIDAGVKMGINGLSSKQSPRSKSSK